MAKGIWGEHVHTQFTFGLSERNSPTAKGSESHTFCQSFWHQSFCAMASWSHHVHEAIEARENARIDACNVVYSDLWLNIARSALIVSIKTYLLTSQNEYNPIFFKEDWRFYPLNSGKRKKPLEGFHSKWRSTSSTVVFIYCVQNNLQVMWDIKRIHQS